MALWVGVKREGDLTVISGDGNPVVKEFPEWAFEMEPYEIDDISQDPSVVKVFRSVYDDGRDLPGHSPVGITVDQRIFEYKHFPALIFEFTVTTSGDTDSLTVGTFFDFDLPETDNSSNAYNDHVLVDSLKKAVFMANDGQWESGPVPAVVVLSNHHFNCQVKGRQEVEYDDPIRWQLLSHSESGSAVYSAEDDYRFILSSDTRQVSAGDSLVFAVALVHVEGFSKLQPIINNLQHWYDGHPPLFRQEEGNTGHATSLPTEVTVSSNYPNPFNPYTEFTLLLPRENLPTISIYDVKGRLVKTLFEGRLPAGPHAFSWKGRDHSGKTVASGVYFLQIRAKGFHHVRKLTFVR